VNGTSVGRPVRGSDRVTDVLARDEALVEVFISHSAHFSKLRNRAMRRIMGRLVTVQDASRMAAVPVDVLLHDLNAALGISTGSADGQSALTPIERDPPSGAAHPTGVTIVDLDVRDDLRQGREPLARIMAAASALGHGEVLHLRAMFEPVPLFAVLAARGFTHETRASAPDDWSVWFWRDPACLPNAQQGHSSQADAEPAGERRPAAGEQETLWLDVRGLLPPEPLVRTLAALETLPPGHQLVQLNERVPQLLLPMLAERGYACELDESHADRVLLRIWRPA
jgi:uncharacterized protein (DUF2249 family)